MSRLTAGLAAQLPGRGNSRADSTPTVAAEVMRSNAVTKTAD